MDFTKLKAMIGDMAGQIRDKQNTREKLLQQREEILSAPIGKEDLKNLLDEHCNAEAGEYQRRLQLQLEATILRKPGLDVKTSGFPLFSPHAGGNKNTILPAGLIALMGAQLKDNLHSILDSIDFPEGSDQPLEERRQQIEEIDSKLEKIDHELQELQSAAHEAGVKI